MNMKVILLTADEFLEMKTEIIREISATINKANSQPVSAWIRTPEACKRLNISSSSLQNLRNSGKLPFSKVNGTIFYRVTDVESLLESNLNTNKYEKAS
jgi:hypothetical protein